VRKLTLSEVVRTIEVSPIALTGGESLHLRLEVLKQGKRFVGRVYRWEFFRIQPTFPQHKGRPAHDESDEMLLVRDNTLLSEVVGASGDKVVENLLGQLRLKFNAR